MSERKYTLKDLRRSLECSPDVLAELDYEIENNTKAINIKYLDYEGHSLSDVLDRTLYWSGSRAGEDYWDGVWHDMSKNPEKYKIPDEIPVTDERHPLRELGYVFE